MRTALADVLARRPVALDGGLATRLEQRGHDLSSDLWSARLLVEDPAEIEAAHRDYFAAGAEVAITASYQVSYEGLATLGLDHERTDELLGLSVALARRAADGFPGDRWVAASVGPYGATLGDGEEYVGDYELTLDELRAWHRPRLAALVAAEPDVLAIETIPCRIEVEALLAEMRGSAVPCWISLTADGLLTRQGEPLAEVCAMARDVPEVIAVGVNCCTADTVDAVVRLAAEASGKPVVVYPNSGEDWDGAARRWVGAPTFQPDRVTSWVQAGARLVGGCCRVDPPEIERIAALLR